MKNLSLALFAVLFLAVAGLYILHFSGNRKTSDQDSSLNSGVPVNGIAYVNIDSVILKLDLYSDKSKELLEKQKKAEAELNSKGTQYEKNAKDYQDKASKGLITRATAAEIEQSLYQQQQELVSLRDQLQSNLAEEESVMNRQVIDYITSYLNEKKAEYNCQYIFGKSFGSVLLYSDGALDITKKVLDGLNAKYQAGKK